MAKKYDMEMDITGMSCSHCVKAVTDAIKGVKGVKKVDVKLEDNKAYINGTDADRDAIAAAVREVGFDVKD